MMTASTRINSRLAARCATALAVSAGTLLLGTAQAAPLNVTPIGEVPSVVVHYDDLNLATHEGSLKLYNRIVAAARAVCPKEDSRELTRYHLALRCQDQAIERAVHELHNPQLAAIHASMRG